MKKIVTSILTTLIPFGLMALPLGNPLEPSLLTKGVFSCCFCPTNGDPNLCDVWSLKIGYYGDFVWNRHMEINHNENHPRSRIREVQLETDAALIALNFWNRFDLFCTLGGTEIFLDGPGGVFNPSTIEDNRRRVRITTNTDFAWSCGLRGTIWECGCFGLGAEVQYAHASPHLFSLRMDDFASLDIRSSGHIDYHEWQIGMGAAYRIRLPRRCVSLVPYAGVKWAHAVMKASHPEIALTSSTTYNLSNFENARDFGGAVGVALVGCSRASLSLEGRFYDENAIHIDLHFRF